MKNLLLSSALFLISILGKAQSVTELGFYSPLISTFDMKYASDHLLISQQGLKIFDVSNPANPQQVATAAYPGSYAYVIDVNGNYAYMAEGGSGYFSVYDISTFSSPSLSGSVIIPSTAFAAGDLVSKNSTAYMTALDSLYVIDVTNPSIPVFAGSQQVVNISFGSATSLVLLDSSLFVLNSGGITVFDISNPLLPIPIDTLPLTHAYHTGLAIDTINHRLFSPWANALQTHMGYDAYDVSNPHASGLLFTDSTSFGNGEFGMCDYYNNLLIISRGGGVAAFDASNGTHGFLTTFSGVNVPNSTVAIEIRDSVFYNARRGGFEILQYNGGFPTSIGNAVLSEFNISPNPVPGNAMLYITGMKGASIVTILSLQGEAIAERMSGVDGMISVPNLAKGMYLVQVTNDKQTWVKKIIVE